jgi:molecular chaperone GrpE (heat shock protein)
MSERRQVWATLGNLLLRLERDLDEMLQRLTATPPGALEQEVRKLGKTQFKANMLAEQQAAQVEQVLAELKANEDTRAAAVDALIEQRLAAERHSWLTSLLPALDGLDNAISSGQKYLTVRDKAATTPHLSAEQARLVSPTDRAKLANWLDGLRLVRERLLAVLEAHAVIPIPTVGHTFDPYQHIAVATTSDAANLPTTARQPGRIVAEERRGYRTAESVLRYADVVVYKPAGHADNVAPPAQPSAQPSAQPKENPTSHE